MFLNTLASKKITLHLEYFLRPACIMRPSTGKSADMSLISSISRF